MDHVLELAKQMLHVDTLPKYIEDTLRNWWLFYCRTGGGAVNPGIIASILACLAVTTDKADDIVELIENTAEDIEEPQEPSNEQNESEQDETPEEIFGKTEGEIVNVKWRFGKLVKAKLIGYTDRNNAKVLILGNKEPSIVRSENIIVDYVTAEG